MALYTNIYPALKAADATNAQAMLAAMAQASEWRPECIARFCKIIGCDPAEMESVVRQHRQAQNIGLQWFVPQ